MYIYLSRPQKQYPKQMNLRFFFIKSARNRKKKEKKRKEKNTKGTKRPSMKKKN